MNKEIIEMSNTQRPFSQLNDEERILALRPLLPNGYDEKYKSIVNDITTIMDCLTEIADNLMISPHSVNDEHLQLSLNTIDDRIDKLEAFASQCPRYTQVLAYNIAHEHTTQILDATILTFRNCNNLIFGAVAMQYHTVDYLTNLQSIIYTAAARFFAVMKIIYPGCITS